MEGSGLLKRVWLVLMIAAAFGFISWLMPDSASAQCCDKTCVDSDGDDFADDSIACNQLLLKGVGTLTGCIDLGVLCEGGQFLSKKPILAPLYPLLSGCLCLIGGCSPAGAEACAASAAEACLAGGNAKKKKDDPACGPVVKTIMCEPVAVTQTHGEGFLGNASLGKVVNGKIPCVHSETAATADCVFNPSTVSWLESPSGTYVLMGQAIALDGAPNGEYVTAGQTSAQGTLSCVEPTGGDTAGTATGTELSTGYTPETFLSASNASGAPLVNYADLTVCSSDKTHPDAHAGGPEKTGCFVNENGSVSCCWTGEGAALNDPYGRERDRNGHYLGETYRSHVIIIDAFHVVNAAKRPATVNAPGPAHIDPASPIVWRPVSPLTFVANGGTIFSGCEPVEVTQVHIGDGNWDFLGNSRLAKIEDGKVPCLHNSTLELAECEFDLDYGSWLESPSGTYALIGQDVHLPGDSGEGPVYIVGSQVNTADNVPCVDPSSLDRAGTSARGTLSAFCVNEMALSSQNATRRPLVNYANEVILSSSNPHPDAHEGGPTVVSCNPDYCEYTGEGAALNDIYGTERDVNGVYYPGIEQCHMIVQSGVLVPGAKRTGLSGNLQNSPIQWLPVFPTVHFANGPTSACYPAATSYEWPGQVVDTGRDGGSTPVNNTTPTGTSYNYFAQGISLSAYSNADGSPRWPPVSPFGSTIPDAVSPVTLSSGTEVIFVAAQDGRLWKIDAADPSIQSWVDTHRSTSGSAPSPNTFVTSPVCATDQLMASPVVQLNRLANSAFRAAMESAGRAGGDLVFVISNNQCSDTTHNTIKAYYASDLSLRWVFNSSTSNAPGSSPRDMDRGGGCVIHYGSDNDPAANTLYCGTLAGPDGTQRSLWAVNAITGGLRWSYNAGSLENRPGLKAGPNGLRVYVVNYDGAIMAYSPVADPQSPFQGRPLWSTPLQVPLKVEASPFLFTQPSGPNAGKNAIALVDLGGNLRLYDDLGSDGLIGPAQNPSGVVSTTPCASGTLCYVGTPQVSLGLYPPKVYVARNDGRVQQLSITLAREDPIDIRPDDTNATYVFGPSLDVSSSWSTITDRLVALAGGYLSRLRLPICSGTGG